MSFDDDSGLILPSTDLALSPEASAPLAHLYQPDPESWADQLWRLHNLYWILDKRGSRVKFQPNWAQIELYQALHDLNVVLKARQLGFTTFIDLIFLDNCVFQSDKRAGIICHNREDAAVIFRDKVKFPFDQLPEAIRNARAPNTDTANELHFANNSSIRVGTSMRSGTLQYLHISEYGKLCARYPDKAVEIRTGAMNTVQAGKSMVIVESTAEGQHGHFFELCDEGQKLLQLGTPLTKLDYKFHFFPWWRHPDYTLEVDDDFVIDTELAEYFLDLETEHAVRLTLGQKAWYSKKLETQGEFMKREFPSTPAEAFEASIQGAYYSKEMRRVRLEKRIRRVPVLPQVPVNTFWDLGFNDDNAIWLHQQVGMEHRFIGYYENSGEKLAHYVRWLREQGHVYGTHFFPHDVENKTVARGESPRDVLRELGLKPIRTVDRIAADRDGIEAVRAILGFCWFDEASTKPGIKALDHYRKVWDDKLGTWKDEALDDWASHGAKAFEQFALTYKGGRKVQASNKKGRHQYRSRSYRTV